MTKPFALQTVLDLMQIRADEATRNLARLIGIEKDAKAKLEMLQQYRDEYATRFRESAQNGLSQREWHNFQQFLNRLDEAIDSQRKKLKAFDTLSERHFANETAREMKKEQKVQDEFAARTKDDNTH